MRYVAYAESPDRSRLRLDAASIVVEIGGEEIEISLGVRHPIVDGKLDVRSRSGGLLVLGPGDGTSIYLTVGGRLKRP